MKELIPFDLLEKKLIEKGIYKPNQGKRGRPSTPVKILIGALFLQAEKAIFADSGYMSQDRKRKLRSKGIFNAITERRVRGQSKLRPKQSKNNTKFSKVRALVELPFAFIKNGYQT